MYPMYNTTYSPFAAPQTAMAPRYEIIRVSGKGGAEAFQMAPNSQILLLDESAPVVWLKTTDGGGYGTLTAYDISIHEEEKPVDYKSIEERLKRLEEIVNESHAVKDPVE